MSTRAASVERLRRQFLGEPKRRIGQSPHILLTQQALDALLRPSMRLRRALGVARPAFVSFNGQARPSSPSCRAMRNRHAPSMRTYVERGLVHRQDVDADRSRALGFSWSAVRSVKCVTVRSAAANAASYFCEMIRVLA